jgi:hypothetical protein
MVDAREPLEAEVLERVTRQWKGETRYAVDGA